MRKIIACIILASCGTMYDTDPVGVGFDANELKTSPCACLQIDLLPGLPEWYQVNMA